MAPPSMAMAGGGVLARKNGGDAPFAHFCYDAKGATKIRSPAAAAGTGQQVFRWRAQPSEFLMGVERFFDIFLASSCEHLRALRRRGRLNRDIGRRRFCPFW